MKFAYFDQAGRVAEAHNDDTIHTLPGGAVMLTEAQFLNRFDYKLDANKLELNPIVPPAPSLESIRLKVLQKAKAELLPAFAALDIMRQDELVIIATSEVIPNVTTAKINTIAIQAFIQGLRDVMVLDLSAFNSEAELLTAFINAYKALVAAAPTALKPRFKAALARK